MSPLVRIPPAIEPQVNELLNYGMWLGGIVFTIGLIWAFVAFFFVDSDDAPGRQDQRRNYVGLVIFAGILISAAMSIAKAVIQ